MRANRVSAYLFGVAASLAGCAGGSGEVMYSGQVAVASPELIELEPGVEVVADADEPLFYSDGYYWLYRDGYWMRSNDYRSGFTQVQLSYVPERVRVIDHPQMYVQYRRNHPREYQARRQEMMQRRSRTEPRRTDVYRSAPGQSAPSQSVPSVPPPDTWQRDFDRTHRPGPPDANPLPNNANPTPPVRSPNDVHGTPMPPHQATPTAPQQQSQPRAQPDRSNGSTINSESGNDRRPMAPGADHGQMNNSDRGQPNSGDRQMNNDDRERDHDVDRDIERNDRANERANDRGQMNSRDDDRDREPADRGDSSRVDGGDRGNGNSASAPGHQKRETRDNRDKDDRGNSNPKKH
jgi:hypothetical protein